MKISDMRWWPKVKRVTGVLYLVIVGGFFIQLALDLNWSGILRAITHLPPTILAAALLLSAASHLLYSGFDLIGRLYTGHRLSSFQVMTITFVSYVGNLNFGALIGGFGLRQRLYSRCGLPLKTIAQITGLSMATNWLGYLLLGALLLIGPTYGSIAGDWLPADATAQLLGFAILTVVIGYVLVCLGLGGHTFRVYRVPFRIPKLQMALWQLGVSTMNWTIMALIIYSLLEAGVRYDEVLLTLLAAAVVGAITHIPGGLGVIEGSFVLSLEGKVSREELIGALLVYRAVYYLLPLPAAALAWMRFESKLVQAV